MKKLLLSILILMLFPFSSFCLDSVDEFVLENLHMEVKNADKILCFVGPTQTTNPMPDLKVTMLVSKEDSLAVLFNNIDVAPKSKIVPVEINGKDALEISYEPKAPLKEGYHTFVVKVKKKSNNKIISSFFLINIEGAGLSEEKTKKQASETKAAHVFSDLFSNQHKVKGLFAKVKETARDIDSKASFSIEGSLKVSGWDDFNVTMSSPPSSNFRDSKGSVDRNILGARNFVFYLDYEELYNNYRWSVIEDNKDHFLLQGWTKKIYPESPYQYLITVDKKLCVPISVETFIGAEDALSEAKIEYKKVDGVAVPLKQTTIRRFRDGRVEQYAFYLNDIKVNKNLDKMFEGKFKI